MKKITKLFFVAVLSLFSATNSWGQTYDELYSADFTTVATHSYTQNKTFTLSNKSWTASVSQVNGGVFYLGCNSNNASKGVLNVNSTFSDVVSALCNEDATYNTNKTTAHAYALLFENSYSDVTKVSFGWAGGNNAFQVYLFGDSGSGYELLGSTNYSSSGASVAGNVEWTGSATTFSKFAIVARPGATSSTATSKTLRAASFTIYKTSGGGSNLTASDLAITNQSKALSFDLYNNTTAQVINYTTSSTGNITIEPATPTSYFSYVHDATNKTITVTPIAVTPSAQTITISQEADATYAAGSQTFSVSVADSTPLANIAALTAKTTTASYTVALNNAVVTFVNGNYAYIQDASGAVALYKKDHGLNAGDVLTGTATVSYQLRNANPQITDISGITPVSGSAPDPTEVAQSAWSYTFSNVLSQYFKITGATITSSNNKYYVSLNSESVQLYKVGTAISSSLDLTKTYTITGFPTLYNTTKELQIFVDPDVEIAAEPTILVNHNSLSGFTYEEGNGPSDSQTISVSGANLTANITLTLNNDSDFEISLSEDSGYTNTLSLTQTAGAVASTTVYVRLKVGKAVNNNYSGTLTLSSTDATDVSVSLSGSVTAYVAPVTSLPFTFDGGRSDITTTSGITQEGLDSDYGSSPKLKFNTTGDWVLLQFNERPGVLTFDIKGNGFSSGSTSTFKVQASTDGLTYTDLKTYTELSGTLNEEIDNLAADVRYIKWIYTEKGATDGGNVALGNIALAKYAAPAASISVDPATVNAPASATDGIIDVTYTSIDFTNAPEIVFYESDGITETTYSWINADLDGNNDVAYEIDANDGAARTAYFKVYGLDGEANDVYSELITINQAAYVAPGAGDQFELYTGSLVEGDYIIVYDDGAMNNTVDSSRLQYEDVAPSSDDIITTENGAIVWHIAPSDSYWTLYSSNKNAFAASTGAKNKAQLLADGTDDMALWTVSGSDTYEFVNKKNDANTVNKTLRKNGTYGFACYSTDTGGALSLYKRINVPTEVNHTATLNNGRYWTTFYSSAARYTLPEGAQAFTMNDTHELNLLGTNGRVIPMNTAVIIVSDTASITLTKSDDTSAVTVNGGDNILRGSNYSITATGITGTKYVLGVVGGKLGFYEYTGTNIPANKAYYVE